MFESFVTAKSLFGIFLILTSIGDGFKYTIQAIKIRQNKSSKNISRKFLNLAILNDIVKLIYGAITPTDFYIITSSLFALICMCHMYYEQWVFYPYKKRGLINFKHPNIFIYIVNSILPNRLRRHL